jgi:hypothetical protein
MSRPSFSPAPGGPCLVPAPQESGSRTPWPGHRIVAGRIFYSAAWLDEIADAFSDTPVTPVDVPETVAGYEALHR